MARMLLANAGTAGELAPFVALGRALQARGHRVRVAYSPAFHPEIRAAGLEPVACGPDFGRQEFLEQPELFDSWTPAPLARLEERWRRLELGRSAHELIAAARDADVLVASTLVPFAPLVEGATGVPWIAVNTVPSQLRESHPRDRPERRAEQAALEAFLARTWAEAGFAGRGPRLELSARWLLVASSPVFSQPVTAAPHQELSGFWFHDHPWWGRWRPDDRLAAFVEAEPPLVLTFSSQPLVDPGRVLSVYAEAARLLGLPLLAISGWASFPNAGSLELAGAGRALVSDACPHGWLFPRARAVVHHGGIGVTARALRAGCPALVQPYTDDQVFNAWRVRALGAGAAVHPHRIEAGGVAKVLENGVLRAGVAERARVIGALLAGEGGVTRACEILEAWMLPTS